MTLKPIQIDASLTIGSPKLHLHASRANKKLIPFERGFTSEEGTKERGWYKQLGVAPRKWLGEREYIGHLVRD